MRHAIVCNQPKAIVMRGTGPQIALTEWLVRALDRPAGGGRFATESITLSMPEYRMYDGSASVAKVLYPAFMKSPQHFQESVNMIRSIAELQRVLAYDALGAIVLRASAEQVALAEWLLNSLAKPSNASGPPLPDGARQETVTRTFHLANLEPQGVRDLVTQLRTLARLKRVATYSEGQAIALRGSSQEVARAEQLIRDADQPRAQ
jgi:type II secretory pathway component GspD/PulD (secretin)